MHHFLSVWNAWKTLISLLTDANDFGFLMSGHGRILGETHEHFFACRETKELFSAQSKLSRKQWKITNSAHRGVLSIRAESNDFSTCNSYLFISFVQHAEWAVKNWNPSSLRRKGILNVFKSIFSHDDHRRAFFRLVARFRSLKNVYAGNYLSACMNKKVFEKVVAHLRNRIFKRKSMIGESFDDVFVRKDNAHAYLLPTWLPTVSRLDV